MLVVDWGSIMARIVNTGHCENIMDRPTPASPTSQSVRCA